MKSSKNKTIDTTIDEGGEYLSRCIKVNRRTAEDAVLGKTIVGDCFKIMSHLPREFVDLAIVDPPYNMRKDFGGSVFSKLRDEDYATYTEKWLLSMLPLLKKTASVYVCCDFRCSGVIGEVLSRYLTVRNRITWQREKGRGASRNWKNGMEDIWFATVSSDFTFNLDAVKLRRRVLAPYKENGVPKDWEDTPEGKFRYTCPSNFWDDITVPYWSMSENTGHPTQKPEKLLAKLMLASSNSEDVVFDPFLGSGTSSVTAKKLGRRFLGIEQNERYCVWAEQRLEMADADPSIQGFQNGVFLGRHGQ